MVKFVLMQYKSSCFSIYSSYEGARSLWFHLIQNWCKLFLKEIAYKLIKHFGVNKHTSSLWWFENPLGGQWIWMYWSWTSCGLDLNHGNEHAHMEIDIRAHILDSPSGWWVLILLHLSRLYNFGLIPYNHNFCFPFVKFVTMPTFQSTLGLHPKCIEMSMTWSSSRLPKVVYPFWRL